MLKIVVAHSEDPDSQTAIEEVLEQSVRDLADMVPKAGILFAAIDFQHTLILKEIDRVFPGLNLIGCTTDGEISSVVGFQQDSLTLMLFCSDTVEINIGVGYGVRENPIDAAYQAVQHAIENSSSAAKLCIPLPASYIGNGLSTSGESILKGLKLALNSNVPIVGGTAGDQYRFTKTYQFFRTEVLTNALPILIFSGDILFSHGIACGWEPIGAKGTVTKVDETVVYEIDHKPAIEFYQRYLGEHPPTMEHPLAVYQKDSDRYYMRVPYSCDIEIGSVSFLGDVPEQAMVRVTDISRDEVVAASETSLKIALQNYPGKEPKAALLFSCCCRRWLLGTRAKEEYELVRNALSEEVPICGFYTYGEFSPLEPHGSTYYHQETFVTLLLGTD
ncbi:FIST C-terminal domain-containing protein [Aetokthonos hydrillicola Thurmond2011]|jgi:hypothetical protein|uniref:FIST C-terminal domain-containing protein n=1 Tax=Aetokthonos hydrillicola Thurmond2011 TaxID=2712845 RepID=A0AAP5IGK5_9CYAN|nr:FIST N-terminal domain-containing protein [Aetokthonos hydrillicola]MBO3460753.1 hypothetical protein [Aetokthonos hydrillicola CCALA 1050]MBW4586388.1 FIST C-terminal domain-containing protein [Aetokthonos hydrillicola CCALA 1050]MDR9899907.1 FIST C-terminal domain-containing protein [Aetokthonos hydrillicola Thurmond2011]